MDGYGEFVREEMVVSWAHTHSSFFFSFSSARRRLKSTNGTGNA